MNIPILYEDNHLLVVEKQVNIPVQEDRSGDQDMLNLLKNMIKVRDQKPGNVYLALVHRLDRPVGGVMVFAKTSKAASRLSDALRKNMIERTYLAVVRGKPKHQQTTLKHFLYKDRRRNFVHTTSENHPKAKEAILDYKVLDHANNLSLLSIKLHTGRPHQVRVQLSAINTPLYGDQRYGKHVNQPGQQIALWAHTLTFPHTTTNEKKTYKSLPPLTYPWNIWPSVIKR